MYADGQDFEARHSCDILQTTVSDEEWPKDQPREFLISRPADNDFMCMDPFEEKVTLRCLSCTC